MAICLDLLRGLTEWQAKKALSNERAFPKRT